MLAIEKYSIVDVQDEVHALVDRGSVSRQQRIYELRGYFGDRQWQSLEQLLNLNDYLLKDYVIDLVGHESWSND
jgi:hypothetical protein